jgi:hypothetical protein
LPGFLTIFYHTLDGLVECNQQSHVAADDLGQDALGGAYLLLSAFIGE